MIDAGLGPRFEAALRDAGAPLTAAKLKRLLVEDGAAEAAVDRAWTAFRKLAAFHPHITRPSRVTYAWSPDPVTPSEALARLGKLLATTSRDRAAARDALVAIVHSGLSAAAAPSDEGRFQGTRLRQARLDGMLAVADLAGEVEEMAYNSGDPDLIVERLQTRVEALAVQQHGRCGEEVPFDPQRHTGVGSVPRQGGPVTVVRPGYTWRDESGETVVLQRVQVAEA
ncbi:hypothetical protein Val02_51780 [Virgisporangium aliadipatigenens]|uniref:Nucleotide exchange factor GrpE n=1 Tax=Virgisporangium aliadipatigenens TaxID=741659 RepID=A0A8J3YPW1_9ACTN|nr:hypothetical protein [Virgisporangium aliadipatigenens]GIJ48292.1 hypothetical protein Val02_51780 [Virgisporangium aliadipatigenens]